MSNKKCNKCLHKNICKYNDDRFNVEECEDYLTLDLTKAKHTFTFETDIYWKPTGTACWSGCPFSFFIGIGNHCICLDGKYKCPFVNNIETKRWMV